MAALLSLAFAVVAPVSLASEGDDDDDEVIEEVVVTAYRSPIINISSGYGWSSFAYYDDNGRLRTSDQDAYEWLKNAILGNVCLPEEIKAIGGAVAAEYVCSKIQIPKNRFAGLIRTACTTFALLYIDDIPEC